MIKLTVNAREMVTYEKDFEFETEKERDDFLSYTKGNCKNKNISAGDYFSARDIVDGDGIEIDDFTISENNKDITGKILEE